MVQADGGGITSAAVFGISIAAIVLILGIIWMVLFIRAWIKKYFQRGNLSDLERADAKMKDTPTLTPPISRPLRILPVGQTSTVVRSPLAPDMSSRVSRLKRSTSMPLPEAYGPKRKRTIVWFDEFPSHRTLTTLTPSQLEPGSHLIEPSSNSQIDDIEIMTPQLTDSQRDSLSSRSHRSYSLSILPIPSGPTHELRKESSLGSVSQLWLTYQANQF